MKITTVIFRGIIRFRGLCVSRILPKFYSLQMSGIGIHYGKGLNILGYCSLKIDRTAHVTIGENFCLVSSNLINPLCKCASCINVGRNAILQIGDNVGMSSPTIWVRKSLIIKNNVNIGGG